MKVIVLSLIAVILLQLASQGEGVCCHGKGPLWKSKCADCSKGTPYCPHGKSCNVFGCNCDGGCRTGPCPYGGYPVNIPDEVIPGDYGYAPNSAKEDMYESDQNGAGYEANSATDNMYESDQNGAGYEANSATDNMYESNQNGAGYEANSATDNMYESDQNGAGYEANSATDNMYGSDYQNFDKTTVKGSVIGKGDENEKFTPEDVISGADENGDGQMDVDEAKKYLYKRGLLGSGYRIKRSLYELDVNNDNYITADEIDSSR